MFLLQLCSCRTLIDPYLLCSLVNSFFLLHCPFPVTVSIFLKIRVFQLEFGNDMAITTTTRAGDAFFTTDFLDQQNIALVDDIPR